MKLNSSLVKGTLSALLLLAAGTAQAAQTFSVRDWSRTQTKKSLEHIDFKKIEALAIPACVECESKALLAKARGLFTKGDFEAALTEYNKVPKGSDQWLQAVEERGWAQYRQDHFEKALAQTKTLLSPAFSDVVDNEAFFLQALSQLRICDYAGVLETNSQFKKSQRDRLVLLQNLAKTGTNTELENVLKNADQFPLALNNLGTAPSHLPMLFYRDLEVQKQILRFKINESSLQFAKNSNLLTLTDKLTRALHESRRRLNARLAALAQEDINKSAKIIQKLNLVEVEAIQRIHADLAVGEKLYKKNEFAQTSDDQLLFMDDGRPWIDELDKYDVAAKVCSKNIRRKM